MAEMEGDDYLEMEEKGFHHITLALLIMGEPNVGKSELAACLYGYAEHETWHRTCYQDVDVLLPTTDKRTLQAPRAPDPRILDHFEQNWPVHSTVQVAQAIMDGSSRKTASYDWYCRYYIPKSTGYVIVYDETNFASWDRLQHYLGLIRRDKGLYASPADEEANWTIGRNPFPVLVICCICPDRAMRPVVVNRDMARRRAIQAGFMFEVVQPWDLVGLQNIFEDFAEEIDLLLLPTCGAQPVGLGSIRSVATTVKLFSRAGIIASQSVPTIGIGPYGLEVAAGQGVAGKGGVLLKGGNLPESRSSDLAAFVQTTEGMSVPAWESGAALKMAAPRSMSRQNSGTGIGGVARSRESSTATLRNP